MNDNLKDLSDATSRKISNLAENWDVDEDTLLEEYQEIVKEVSESDEHKFSDKEERQNFAVQKLSVEVAVDKEGFNSESGNAQRSRGFDSSGEIDLCLRDGQGEEMTPLTYSTGKNQAEVVDEILEAFEESDIVFLKGVVGSGKSVIGIRTALEFGGGTVSVPTKVLSKQYRNDYGEDKYFVKDDGGRAQISVMKGRDNFTCPYLEDEYPGGEYNSCQNRSLPCSRPLHEDESRLEAVRECPYWGFIFPTSTPIKRRNEHIGSYRSLAGRHSLLLSQSSRKCPYWSQFKSYLEADVNVMNSRKWEVETLIGRLPLNGVTVIDEADAWLDSLSSRITLTDKRLSRLSNTLRDDGLRKEAEKVRSLWSDYREGFEEAIPLAEDLVEVLESTELGSTLYWDLKEVLDMKDEVVTEEQEEEKLIYYVPDPGPVLSKFRNREGGKWLLMSATAQDKEVLEKVYGIDPAFVEGETKFPGKLIRKRLGSEEKVNNKRWKKRSFRKHYAKVRDRILEKAEKPCFVPVHATKYLPQKVENLTEEESKEYDGVVFSTKMDRGADLDEMNSVVLLKYPYPNLGDPLLRATKKRLGEKKFWMYYHDMAEREFIQQIGRTVRSPGDEVEFWSPDAMCHRRLKQSWKGEIIEGNNPRY